MSNVITLPNVGDKVTTWFSESPDGKSIVLAVLPYRGPFAFIACILRVTAPRTERGYMEMSWEKGEPVQ